MVIATLLPNGRQTFYDQNGVPLVGGSVYFYIPNTSTPKNTWQDTGEITLNSNPVILDSLGSALIYGSGQYRQLVRDVNGNIIWDALTQDIMGLFSPQTSPTNGTALIGFLQPGGVARTLYSKLLDLTFSVKDFGAVGDGATDDTAAIQAALSALTTTPATLYFPAGSYRITSALSVTFNYTTENATTRPSIYGDGPGNTQILWDGANTPSTFMLTISRTDTVDGPGTHAYSTIAGLSFGPINGAKNFFASGLNLQKWSNLDVHDIHTSYLTTGLQLDQIKGSKFDSITANNNNTLGIYSLGSPSSSLSSLYTNLSLTFINCTIANNQIGGFRAIDSSFTFVGGSIEGNGQSAGAGIGYGVYINITTAPAQVANVCTFVGTRFDANGTTGDPGVNPGFADAWILHSVGLNNLAYNFTGCVFVRNGTNYASYGIYLDKTGVSTANLNVTDTIFTNYNSYTPSANRLYIKTSGGLVGGAVLNITATGNYYTQSTEEPTFVTGAAYFSGNVAGFTRIKSYCGLVYLAGTQTINSGASTPVNFDTAVLNDTTMWTVGSPSQLFVPAGATRVRLSANVRWSSITTAQSMGVRIFKNGATFPGAAFVTQETTSAATTVNLNLSTGVIVCATGDYFQVLVTQTTGSSLTLDNSVVGLNWFSLEIVE